MASENTLVCIEVPYAADMIRGVQFDTVYHEHLSYVTLRPIVELLKRTPFQLHRINRYGIHGGVLLLMLRRTSCGLTPHLSVEEMLSDERVSRDSWDDFRVRTRMKIENLHKCVKDLREKGKIVSAFGASAKATVLLNACAFTRLDVGFVTDNSPFKPGCLIPGTDIPVIEEGEMLAHHPDYSIMTSYNYELEILAKMSRWRERGGKFIIPDNELRIV